MALTVKCSMIRYPAASASGPANTKSVARAACPTLILPDGMDSQRGGGGR
jgi:hypothetical protein